MAGVIGSAPTEQSAIVRRMKLGLLFRAMREKKGKTQRDTSASLGYENASFVCNVEKGANNVPINKVKDFASEYCPEDRFMLQGAIMKSVMPEIWEASLDVFYKLLKSTKSKEELSENVDTWLEKKFEEFGVTF